MTIIYKFSIIKTDTYQYTNTNWQDQLTSFNNESITYDAIGNPLAIGSNITLSWINGRNLNSYTDTSKNLSISYKYNREGIRTNKIINGVETKYYLESNSIIYEQRGDTLIYYLYDLTGLIGIKYNGNIYHYIKNLQGNIIGLLDVNNEQVVSYEYDSWGSLISIKDQDGNVIIDETNIGIINPFRYREYYYDSEIGMYYLNSRYYNPTWGRFINADGIIGANQDILGYNLYAYVSNNPVMFSDPSGYGDLDFLKGIINKLRGIKEEEVKNVFRYPGSTLIGLVTTVRAINYGKKIFGKEKYNLDNGEANAYRHAFWSAQLTYLVGSSKAETITSAHEVGEDSDSSRMDYYNNAVGREIGNIYLENYNALKGKTNSQCFVQSFTYKFVCVDDPSQSFTYLGKQFTIYRNSNSYDIISEMVLHALAQEELKVIFPGGQ